MDRFYKLRGTRPAVVPPPGGQTTQSSTKPVIIKNGPVTFQAIKNGSCFHIVLEQLEEKNLSFWQRYCRAMKDYIVLVENQLGGKYQAYKDALVGFENGLGFYDLPKPPKIWIAYATLDVGTINANDQSKIVAIEMCMTLTTDDSLPFTTHMGIFRTPLMDCYDVNAVNKVSGLKGVADLIPNGTTYKAQGHSGISLLLHSCAARAFFSVIPSMVPKRFMITAPLVKMSELFTTIGARPIGTEDSEELVRCEVMSEGFFPLVTIFYDDTSITCGPQKHPWLSKLVFADKKHLPAYIELKKLKDVVLLVRRPLGG